MFMDRRGVSEAAPEIPNPVLSQNQLLAAIDTARHAGFLVLHCGDHFMNRQHVAIHPLEDEVLLWWEGHEKADRPPRTGNRLTPSNILTSLKALTVGTEGDGADGAEGYYHGAMLLDGLHYRGVARQNGRLRRGRQYLELSPLEIKLGDIINLSDENESQRQPRSFPVTAIEEPLTPFAELNL